MTQIESPRGRRRRVAIIRALPEPVIAAFKAAHDVWVNPHERTLKPDEVQLAAEQADVLVVTAANRFDRATIDRFPSTLQVLSTYSVGFEHVDLEAAKAHGIAVLNTPDVLSDAVAEMAILLMLGAARRALEGHQLLYSGRWPGWTPTQLIGTEVTGQRIGILGMGRIGRTIARRARGFDMAVHYHNRRRLEANDEQGATFHATTRDLLAQSDVLVLAAPSSADTRGILNDDTISFMPEGAIIVNIARGDLIDDNALIGALQTGRIAAAGLDVFNGEPMLNEQYTRLPNVFLQPHQGSSTVTARVKMGQALLDGIVAIDRGTWPANRLV